MMDDKSIGYIFGKGGHARVISSVIDTKLVAIVHGDHMDDELSEDHFFANIEEYKRSPVFIGICNNVIRTSIFERLKVNSILVSNCISSHSFISNDVSIGQGVVICPGVVINASASIGDNVIVNTLSSVDHDCEVGDNTQITAGVTIAGTVKIGKSSFFGIKSAVIPNINIGNNVIVMAGSLVCDDVPDSVMVGGSPARIVKKID